jgi:hypothetical protein
MDRPAHFMQVFRLDRRGREVECIFPGLAAENLLFKTTTARETGIIAATILSLMARGT